jgi:hypothetical protein
LERFDRVTGHQDVIADAAQDTFDRATIELLVIDDEDVIFLQGGSPLRGGGARSVGEPVWSGQMVVQGDLGMGISYFGGPPAEAAWIV